MGIKDFMLDLETMGNTPHSPIVAIGVVAFDEGGIHDVFECNVDLRSHLELKSNHDTVLWWLQQSEPARKKIFEAKTPISQAVEELTMWMRRFSDRKEARVWGNGAPFDCTILRENCRATAMVPPWDWWNDRCYRTLKNLHKDIEMVRNQEAHTALGDALMQAEHLVAICKAKGVRLG